MIAVLNRSHLFILFVSEIIVVYYIQKELEQEQLYETSIKEKSQETIMGIVIKKDILCLQ